MRSILQECLMALKIVLVLALINTGLAFAASVVGFSLRSAFGDLLMLEAAICFVTGGILDFVSSAGAVQLRRLMFREKELPLPAKPGQNERRALVLVIAGIILLLAMVSLVVYDLTFH